MRVTYGDGEGEDTRSDSDEDCGYGCDFGLRYLWAVEGGVTISQSAWFMVMLLLMRIIVMILISALDIW